jgi:hypothetical protein
MTRRTYIVTFNALDFRFEGPAEIPSGMTRFRMVSSGKELHHMTIVKLAEGKTMDSLMAAMAVPGPIPAWVTFIGGPNPSAPGGESNATVYMEPGDYAVFCVVDTPDHQMHVLKGMVSSLSVVPATTPVAMTLPEPTITVTMNEYTFALDKPLTAGKHSIRLLNTGMEPHEFVLIKMEPGKTLMDLGMWMEKMEGPLPGVPMGGLSPATNGRDGQFDVDITPGSYLLVCFLPAPDGKMHFEHGMTQMVEVQ